MKYFTSTFFAILVSVLSLRAQEAEVLSVQKIWDKGGHNGATDLARFQNLFFCCFREGATAQGGASLIRIMISSNGMTWVDYANVSVPGIDLRDPKLEVTGDGKRLFLTAGGSVLDAANELTGRRTYYSTSTDGKIWTPPQKLLAEGDWLWRCTLNPADKKFYGAAFNIFPSTGGPKEEAEWSLKSYTSSDGSVWQLSSLMKMTGKPGETTLRFLKDGSAVALVRRHGADMRGAIGTAAAPYREWKWTALSTVVQGQNFIQLPNGTLVAGSRGVGKTPGAHMVLLKMTATTLEPLLELPSGGDCSYPGMLWHEGHLWVSYYSSHEGKPSIYVAKVKLPQLAID